MNRTFIIAEAGVNHNGSIDIAKHLIDAASDAKADAIKFQTFDTKKCICRSAPKAGYQVSNTGIMESQYDMVKRLELDEDVHKVLKEYCREKNLEFMSTPFDLDSVDILMRVGVSHIKIASGEITNAPLILKIARCKRPVILSTGMSTINDIEDALGILAFGYADLDDCEPSIAMFRDARRDIKVQKLLKKNVVLLHCTTEYPAPYNDVNLRAMAEMRSKFGLSVGLSDHTIGYSVPIAAVALSATVIEKHLTLDRDLPGPDHRASLEPGQFCVMVRSIREVESALGSPTKSVAPSEQKNIPIARKSLVAMCDIKIGEEFTDKNLTCKRPGTGISPFHYWEWIHRTASRDYMEDDLIVE